MRGKFSLRTNELVLELMQSCTQKKTKLISRPILVTELTRRIDDTEGIFYSPVRSSSRAVQGCFGNGNFIETKFGATPVQFWAVQKEKSERSQIKLTYTLGHLCGDDEWHRTVRVCQRPTLEFVTVRNR